VHNGVSISESALVLGAWKFQQGKFCNCEAIWPRVFCICSSPGRLLIFLAKEGHTCERRRRSNRTRTEKGRMCEQIGQLACVKKTVWTGCSVVATSPYSLYKLHV
jgi:hypothetical protein